jgi:hypothetical protein
VIRQSHQEIPFLVKMKSYLLPSKPLNLNFGWHFLTDVECVSPFVYFGLALSFVQTQHLVRYFHNTSTILFSLPLEKAPLHLVHDVGNSLLLLLYLELFLFLLIQILNLVWNILAFKHAFAYLGIHLFKFSDRFFL